MKNVKENRKRKINKIILDGERFVEMLTVRWNGKRPIKL